MNDPQTISGFLDALGSKQPTPGGGAAAAMSGAIASSTALMVVEYSIGKKNLADHEDFNTSSKSHLSRARAMFLELAQEDAIGYGALNALWKLDKDDPKRVKEWDNAVAGAISPPRAMVALSIDLMRRIEALVATTNKMLKSDLGVAAVLCEGAARSAAWNVRINLPLVDESTRARISAEIDKEIDTARSICAKIETECA